MPRRNPFHMFGMGATPAPVPPVYMTATATTPVAMMPPTTAPTDSSIPTYVLLGGAALVAYLVFFRKKRS